MGIKITDICSSENWILLLILIKHGRIGVRWFLHSTFPPSFFQREREDTTKVLCLLSGCKVVHWGLLRVFTLFTLTEIISTGRQCFVLHSSFLSSHSFRIGCYYLHCKNVSKTDKQ